MKNLKFLSSEWTKNSPGWFSNSATLRDNKKMVQRTCNIFCLSRTYLLSKGNISLIPEQTRPAFVQAHLTSNAKKTITTAYTQGLLVKRLGF